MNKQKLGGLVRAGLAAAGGYLVSQGLATDQDAATIANSSEVVTGLITVAAAAVWSWWNKRKAA